MREVLKRYNFEKDKSENDSSVKEKTEQNTAQERNKNGNGHLQKGKLWKMSTMTRKF